MIVGSIQDWENFKADPKYAAKLEQIADMMTWLTEDIWYIKELNDGEREAAVLAQMKKTGELPNINWIGVGEHENIATTRDVSAPSVEEIKRQRQINMVKAQKRQRAQSKRATERPPHRPPAGWKKVKSFWKAVTGPKVTPQDRDQRLSQCTTFGGLTWSPVGGTVEEITATSITVGSYEAQFPADELPAVEVGQTIVPGQQLTKPRDPETFKKPCPFLITKDETIEFEGETVNKLYCDGCGCGVKRAVAELHTKLEFANLQCPRTPPLFVPITVEGN